MRLIVAEKPSVGKTIAAVIGGMTSKNGYCEGNNTIVTWCFGHLVGLAEPDVYGKNLPLPICPSEWKFEVAPDKIEQFRIIESLMNDNRVDEIVCATDAGREGECIFRFVYNKVGCRKPVKRLWTSSLEESAITEGLNNLKDSSEYDNLYEAGLCRTKADWLVGINFSRRYNNLYEYPENPITHKKGLNYGRVMTPVLKMIIDRDNKVKNFVKEKYYTIELDCGDFIATSDKFETKEEAERIANGCSSAVVHSVKREIKNQKPPKLYDLTTLQREANRKFGYSAQQTLDYVQELYEAKLVTYPRTDSNYITEDMEGTAVEIFEIVSNYFPIARNISFTPNIRSTINNAKVSEHHALLPTKKVEDCDLNALPEAKRNILYLIASRLLCATAETYTYESVAINVASNNVLFKATGRTDINRGWKAVFEEIQNNLKGEAEEKEPDDKSIPNVSESQVYEKVSAVVAEHWTSPPKPYTEDTLLSAMETAGNNMYEIESGEDIEKKGLGTPATRAAAIEKLVSIAYIERKKKQLFPSEFGIKNITVSEERLKSPKLTVEWETKLQRMEHGEYSPEAFMNEIYQYIAELLDSTKEIPENCKNVFPKQERKSFGKCPKCGGDVYAGKFGYFCENAIGAEKSCKFGLRFEDKFFEWKGIKLTDSMVSDFMKNGKTFVKGMKAKTGNKFDGYIVIDSSGDYVQFKIEFDNSQADKELCKCFKCGGKAIEDRFSFHCENASGQNRSCNVYLKKDEKFFEWRGVKLDAKHAKELIGTGRSHFDKLKAKDKKEYSAYVQLDTSGQYIQYKIEL